MPSLRKNIRNWMLNELNANAEDYFEYGEPEYTKLAEEAVRALAGDNYEEWFQDELHPVWEVSIEVLDGYNPPRGGGEDTYLGPDVHESPEGGFPPRGASTRKNRAGSSPQHPEDIAWDRGREYGKEHPIAEVGNSEDMYQAAQQVGVGMLFDVFKYGAQSVWRETGQMKKGSIMKKRTATNRRGLNHRSSKRRADFDKPLNHWDRYELQEYLENRGFAVYDDEPTDELREAVRLDMEEEGVEFDVEPRFAQHKADKELFRSLGEVLSETKSKRVAHGLILDAAKLATHILGELGGRPRHRRHADQDAVKDVSQNYQLFERALGRLSKAPSNDDMISALEDVVEYGTGILQAIE